MPRKTGAFYKRKYQPDTYSAGTNAGQHREPGRSVSLAAGNWGQGLWGIRWPSAVRALPPRHTCRYFSAPCPAVVTGVTPERLPRRCRWAPAQETSATLSFTGFWSMDMLMLPGRTKTAVFSVLFVIRQIFIVYQ